MFGWLRGRRSGTALALAGAMLMAGAGDGWAQSWELERESGVGGRASGPAPAKVAAVPSPKKAAPALKKEAGVTIVIEPSDKPIVRAAEGNPVNLFDKETGAGAKSNGADVAIAVAPIAAAPSSLSADGSVRLTPPTAADLLGHRESKPDADRSVAALPTEPAIGATQPLVTAPAPSTATVAPAVGKPAVERPATVEQAQFAPNTAATPQAILPPRVGDRDAATVVMPSPPKPTGALATVQPALLTPNVAASPKESVLRTTPAPDNHLVELVETPSDLALKLSAGKGQLLNLSKGVTDVFVADPNIADVRVVSPTQLFVHGNQLGQTNIFGIGAGGDVVFGVDLDVVPNADVAQAKLKAASPGSDTAIDLVSGNLVAEGAVGDVGEAIQVAALSDQLALTQGPTVNNTVINESQQVNIRVRFAEVSRNDVFNLGINWETLVDTGDFLFGLSSGPGRVGQTDAFGTIFGDAQFGDVNVEAFIDALQREGIINLLAEPNLTAINGETANFLAGGEIPIPVPSGAGRDSVTIDYKPFGVSLDFIPTLLPGDRINLRVRPEVSSINETGGVIIDGFSIPAFTVRRAETSVELASGQTFAIAGLFQRDLTTDTDKFPVLGDVPVLGQLFQSQRFRRYETELVILITPYLVKPSSSRIAQPNDRLDRPTEPQAKKNGNRRAGFIVN